MAQCVVSENTREACKMSKVDVVIGCSMVMKEKVR